MKKLLSSVFIIFAPIVVYCQELPKVIGASPEASVLGKYIDIPVSLSSGVPNISIPLVKLKGKEVDIPISLSYHSSGIRVNEIASRNGLGWILNGGGMITRSVRGIPDDDREGYLNTINTIANYEKADLKEKTFLYQKALDQVYDYESDVYYFDFLGERGKFFFNQETGEAIFHKKSDLKISFTKNSNKEILGWKIKMTNGTTYEFGNTQNAINQKEDLHYIKGQSLPSSSAAALLSYRSSWYLTKIVDAFGNETLYSYEKKLNQKITFWNISNNYKEFYSIGRSGGSGAPVGEKLMFLKSQYSPIFLRKIENSFGKVVFEYDQPRQDLLNDKALTGIKLFNKKGKLVDSYYLYYDYFKSLDGNPYPSYGIDSQLINRLFLRRVVEGGLNKEGKEYLLDYNTDHPLPNRFSFSQDFWGYYNGRKNSVLYPRTEVKREVSTVTIDGADRKVYEDYAKAYILKSIIYPTKGKTEFLFESNTIGLTNNEKAFYIGNQYENTLIEGGQLGNEVGFGEQGKVYTSSFSIIDNFPFEGVVDYSIKVEQNCESSAYDCPKIQIVESSGLVVHTFSTAREQGRINLHKGNYKLKIQNGFLQADNRVYITLRGRKLLSSGKNAISGGLRIKEVVFKDEENLIAKKVNYAYNTFGDLDTSSGVSLNPPIYYYKEIPYAHPCINCLTDRIESNPIFPLNGESSSHVTYTNVTQVFKDNGRIESEFSYAPDSKLNSTNIIGFDRGTAYPLVPSLDYSHRRGVLRSEKIYNNLNKLNEETILNYNKAQDPNELNYSSVNFRAGKIGDYSGINRYKNLSERFYLKEKVKKTYSDNGMLEEKIVYRYEDGYSGRVFPIETIVTNSKGELLRIETKYADDVGDSRLIAEHRIAEPIEIRRFKGDKLLSHQKTVYSESHNVSSLYLPELVQLSKGDQELEDRLIYHRYDSKGNPTELSKKDGVHIVYLWGYGQTQPVAKIINARLSDIPSSLILEIQAQSNSEND
ncbi:hypothetical protein, partial [Tenacibaculum maritimum]|uniref:hypothetical protein n=2 Tax=Tenacibaculum maritimum TaxID=107401 RepID=UPI003876D48B